MIRHERERGRINQRTREQYFRLHPLCVMCLQKDPPRHEPATELDHIIPLCKGGTNATSNRQGLCADCHKEKTAQDFGYRPRQTIGLDGWPVEGRK